ncbi:tetratricopeptide repeat protein [Patulibacter sp. NPDC049589]|uniref:tetratricopeptide repeat protein n=1 Tax=Patulibacter sp. NPDC049589 TaxID=3154731 RepID=UPI0034340DE4
MSAERAVDLDPVVREGHAMLGFLAWTEGDLDDAIAHYARAWALDTTDPDIAVDYASLLQQTGAEHEVSAVLRRVPDGAWGADPDAAARAEDLAAA